jgi:hypothetical protein
MNEEQKIVSEKQLRREKDRDERFLHAMQNVDRQPLKMLEGKPKLIYRAYHTIYWLSFFVVIGYLGTHLGTRYTSLSNGLWVLIVLTYFFCGVFSHKYVAWAMKFYQMCLKTGYRLSMYEKAEYDQD